jgi:hypothetical protein
MLREEGDYEASMGGKGRMAAPIVQQGAPEWDGGQVNCFFAGHGTNNHTERPINSGGLFLKDRVIRPKDLQDKLTSVLLCRTLD